MAMLTKEEINELRSSVNIVDVIANYLPLTQKGKNFFGVCPFHDDHAPSLCVSSEKQIYTCFSCGATGNVFTFIMNYEHVSFLEAVQKVALTSGFKIKLNLKTPKAEVDNQLYEIYDLSNKFYQNNINTKDGVKAKAYLKNRQLDEASIKTFELGLALTSRDTLTKLLVNKGYTYDELLKSGLVIKNEYGYSDIYYNRIMFPLSDLDGRVIGFSGRVYNGEKEFKYINTKETAIFKKGEVLYNYHRAKDEARQKGYIIVMEGFMDVIRASMIGINNVIATMGTAVTKENAKTITHMAPSVILMFDGDEAGAKATMAAIKELAKIGVTPKIVRLPDDLDPDDFIISKGQEAFLNYLNKPISVMDFELAYLKIGKNLDNANDMADYVNHLMTELNQIDDPVMKEITINKIAKETNLDEAFLKKQLKVNVKTQPKVVNKPKVMINKYEKAERNLLFYMLKSEDVIKMAAKVNYMPTQKYRYLAREIAYYYQEYGNIRIADFLTYLNDDTEAVTTLGEILALDLKETYTVDEINDYLKTIYDYSLKTEKERLEAKMKATSDLEVKLKLASEILELKKKEQL